MFDKAMNIRTGSIVGEFAGEDGDEIAAVLRLPRSTWERLSKGLYQAFYGIDDAELKDEDVAIEARIEIVLDLLAAEWEADRGLSPDVIGDDLDDDVPF